MTTLDKVRDIVAATLNVDRACVTETLSIGEIPQWDSMGNMAIIAALEENVGVEIPIEDLFELNSISSLVSEIDRLSETYDP